jgi:hypothetical protein
MIQYSFLGRTAASIRLNTTFRGLVLPEDGDGARPRNDVFKRIDAAVRPRKLYWTPTYVSAYNRPSSGGQSFLHKPNIVHMLV